jgi:hypothetical protein
MIITNIGETVVTVTRFYDQIGFIYDYSIGPGELLTFGSTQSNTVRIDGPALPGKRNLVRIDP